MSFTRRSMELAVLLTGIASAIALIGTLLLVARQGRILADQTALANKLAVHRASNDPLTGIRLVYSMFVDHPETYRYFYGGAQLPPAADSELQDELAVRVRTIAELLADTLDLALATTESVGIPERDRAGWEAAIDYWLSASPTLRATIAAQPVVWPWLDDRLAGVTPTDLRTTTS